MELTNEEKKVQEKIAFKERLNKGNRPHAVKTEQQMDSIWFRITVQKQITPTLSMSTR